MPSKRIQMFRSDEKGTVAVLFGISTFLMLGFVGLAVDVARGQSSRSSLQQDVDATILFVGTQAAAAPELHDVQNAAQSYLDGLRRQKQVRGSAKVLLTQPDSITYRAVADAEVPTMLMGLFGIKSLNLQVVSEAKIGQQPVEFALVLDNTLSMAGSKLESLKAAAKSLADTVSKSANSDQFVKMSVVPFADYVNVGMANRNQPWMSVPHDTSTTRNVCRDTAQASVVPGSCRETTYTYMQDGVPATATQQRCEYTYGEPIHQCEDETTTETWYGCAGSRDYPLSVSDDNYSTPVPGAMNQSCPTPITPLTNDIDAVDAAIDAMTVTGNTFIPAGLTWGRAVLSSAAPFEESQSTSGGKKVRKVMVLMTDGHNTVSPTVPYNGYHWNSDTSKANELTTELCTNTKGDGVTIYTVAFNVADDSMKSILQGCASDHEKYFDAANGSELDQAFAQIAADFSPLRLSR